MKKRASLEFISTGINQAGHGQLIKDTFYRFLGNRG